MNKTFLEYQQGIDSLTVFGALQRDPVICGLRELFAGLAKTPAFESRDIIRQYSGVMAALYPCGADLSAYIRSLVMNDDNFYIRAAACGRPIPEEIRRAADQELILLQELACLSSADVTAAINYSGFLPDWTTTPVSLADDFAQRLELLPTTGYGIFAGYTFFRIAKSPDQGFAPGAGPAPAPSFCSPPGGFASGAPGSVSAAAFGSASSAGFGSASSAAFGSSSAVAFCGTPAAAFGSASSSAGLIVPVAHADVQPLHTLFRYEREREQILRNTEALLNGTGASNMLLYGDAGTGKSSTIKAVALEYADRGLRLIEVKKNQLFQIPEILEPLADNPLKFILFIDDLSFSGNDDNFSALKATLEGSVSGCTGNTVIYATSNRRHLVKETFADRTGDELHVNDTLQETMSLAARFGLTITFSRPDKDEYLDIVRSLAAEYGIDMPEEELLRRAEAHAIRKNGRSPRTAKQFIELLKIGL